MAIERGSITRKPRVVIVGGGFAGLQAAMRSGRQAGGRDVDRPA